MHQRLLPRALCPLATRATTPHLHPTVLAGVQTTRCGCVSLTYPYFHGFRPSFEADMLAHASELHALLKLQRCLPPTSVHHRLSTKHKPKRQAAQTNTQARNALSYWYTLVPAPCGCEAQHALIEALNGGSSNRSNNLLQNTQHGHTKAPHRALSRSQHMFVPTAPNPSTVRGASHPHTVRHLLAASMLNGQRASSRAQAFPLGLAKCPGRLSRRRTMSSCPESPAGTGAPAHRRPTHQLPATSAPRWPIGLSKLHGPPTLPCALYS